MVSVSVVIPSVGKDQLQSAIESALLQTFSVLEVIVCLDTDRDVQLGDDPRVWGLRVGPGAGGNTARQAGIEAASGDLIALLDDDDTWQPDKLSRQLALVEREVQPEDSWLATSQLTAAFSNGSEEIWPTRLIAGRESLPHYIFRKHRPIGGVGFIQASTLLFPRSLALRVPFNTSLRFHQDIDWLVRLDSEVPDLRVLQVPSPLTRYAIASGSVSSRISAEMSLTWALTNIVDDPRSLGDFILTSCTSYAARTKNTRGVIDMIRAAFRHGKPGVSATIFGLANIPRSFR
ncbi:glycosyltransferase [Plantibacter sp. CFBP 8804]|uniref:glycosyltransferase n=1 Tax=Plantibacter sp. CFBP 8804 TaxID=2775270 RepID=UPI001780D10B|nr:glycosyltransferase family 2 protein [Plantibacter sp. CFBP 8804]